MEVTKRCFPTRKWHLVIVASVLCRELSSLRIHVVLRSLHTSLHAPLDGMLKLLPSWISFHLLSLKTISSRGARIFICWLSLSWSHPCLIFSREDLEWWLDHTPQCDRTHHSRHNDWPRNGHVTWVQPIRGAPNTSVEILEKKWSLGLLPLEIL